MERRTATILWSSLSFFRRWASWQGCKKYFKLVIPDKCACTTMLLWPVYCIDYWLILVVWILNFLARLVSEECTQLVTQSQSAVLLWASTVSGVSSHQSGSKMGVRVRHKKPMKWYDIFQFQETFTNSAVLQKVPKCHLKGILFVTSTVTTPTGWWTPNRSKRSFLLMMWWKAKRKSASSTDPTGTGEMSSPNQVRIWTVCHGMVVSWQGCVVAGM